MSLKDEPKKETELKTIETPKVKSRGLLFSYCDYIDAILLTIGTICAVGTAGIYPLMFVMYGRVANTLIDYKKNETLSSLPSIGSLNSCFNSTGSDPNFDDRISSTVVLYIAFGISSLVGNYLANVCWNTAAERRIRRLKCLLFQSILKQEIAFFDKNTAGDLNSRITSNMDKVKAGIGFKVPHTITIFCRAIGCLILSIYSAWKFALLILAIVPLIALCMGSIIMLTKKFEEREVKAYGRAGAIAQETLSSLRTVLSLNMQKQQVKKYETSLQEAELVNIKKGLVNGVFVGLTTSLLHVAYAVGVIWAVYLIKTDCQNYPPGTIMQSFLCLITASFSLGEAGPFFSLYAEAKGASVSIFDILEKQSEIDATKTDGLKLESVKGNIKFKNVSFNYPQRIDYKILNGLSLQIEAGQTVALAGGSGCGKSTTIQLIQRFYEPLSGSIDIDGHDIRDYNLSWLRSQMALVSQEPILFALSIKDNIRLGRLDATDAEIEEAAKQANAHSFISTLKDGYDTLVGERGSQLSGGQKQRISIARALVRNPRILLLDEATSALDLESEKVVQDALDKAKIGRTTIIIAHRLNTIKDADNIIVMANGVVAETGTNDALIEKGGIYSELHKRQNKKALERAISEIKNEDESSDDSDESSDNEDIEEEQTQVQSPNSNNIGLKYIRRLSSVKRIESTKTANKKSYLKKVKISKILKYKRLLFALHKPDWVYILVDALSQIVVGATFPVITLVFMEIYGIFLEPNQREQEKRSFIVMGIILGISAASFMANVTSKYCSQYSSAKLIRRLRVKLFESMMRQEVGWHDLDDNRSSVLSSILESSVPLCRHSTITLIDLVFYGVSGFGVSVVVSFVYSWKLALVMFAFVPVSLISGMTTARAQASTRQKGGRSKDEATGTLTIECIENIRTVVSLGREEHFSKKFEKIFDKNYNKNLALLHLQAFSYAMTQSILFFIQATTFGFGYSLVRNEGLPVTSLYRIYASMTFSSMILGRVLSEMPEKKRVNDALKQTFKAILRKSKIDSLTDVGLKPDKVNGEILFHDVHFRYPTRNNKILDGLNLEVKSNQTTALVGHSGCGKSTVIQLLLRFYDVDQGKITLDGIDIRELNINWLRSQIGLVSQEPVLFNCSITENITYGDTTRDNIDIGEIIDVALKANIHPRINSLPDKYNTNVGSKGSQLSGGEKQRVAIARALLRKPKILLLDEATSALDQESEDLVQSALEKAQSGRTCICIAHRLSTIQNAPKISVFENGRILEEGSHNELIKNEKLYYALQKQNKRNKANA